MFHYHSRKFLSCICNGKTKCDECNLLVYILILVVLLVSVSGCMTHNATDRHQYLLSLDKTQLLHTTAIRKYYDVNNLQEKRSHLNAQGLIAVTIVPTSIHAMFNQQYFLYRITDNRYLPDYYNSFLTSPTRQFDALLSQYLRSTGKYFIVTVEDTLSHDESSYTILTINKNLPRHNILHLTIVEMYADYRDRNHPQAVIVVHVKLIQKNSTIKKLDRAQTTITNAPTTTTAIKLIDETLHFAAPLQVKDTESLLQTWEKCVAKLFAKVEKMMFV